jgi:hypothetical protein
MEADIMKVSSGTKPYVFFSYDHADKNIAERLIMGLQQKRCRIWYDEGLTPGECWNDELAERIERAEVLVVVLTENAMKSRYVKAQVNCALSKYIRILPVVAEEVQIPEGVDIARIDLPYIRLSDTDNIDQHIRTIASALPPVVFAGIRPILPKGIESFFGKE